MRRISLIIIGVLIIAGIAYFYTTHHYPIANIHSSGTSIVAFGDSLIQGVGSTEGNDFISLLETRIGEPIVNLGKSGDTTATALDRVDQIWKHDPKIVIVLLGGNDYLRRISIDETFENLNAIVDNIHERGAAVLLLGVRGGLLRDTYNSRFREFARTKQVGFVFNVLDNIIGEEGVLSDSIHPNNAGYEIIADKVEPVLRQMLEENAEK